MALKDNRCFLTIQKRYNEMLTDARENLETARIKQKHYFDKNVHITPLALGLRVKKKNVAAPKGNRPWLGYYTIVDLDAWHAKVIPYGADPEEAQWESVNRKWLSPAPLREPLDELTSLWRVPARIDQDEDGVIPLDLNPEQAALRKATARLRPRGPGQQSDLFEEKKVEELSKNYEALRTELKRMEDLKLQKEREEELTRKLRSKRIEADLRKAREEDHVDKSYEEKEFREKEFQRTPSKLVTDVIPEPVTIIEQQTKDLEKLPVLLSESNIEPKLEKSQNSETKSSPAKLAQQDAKPVENNVVPPRRGTRNRIATDKLRYHELGGTNK